MEPIEILPVCLMCKRTETPDAYELDPAELETLVRSYRIWRAPKVQREYGAVPICRTCIDLLGFAVQGRPGDNTDLVQIRRGAKP